MATLTLRLNEESEAHLEEIKGLFLCKTGSKAVQMAMEEYLELFRSHNLLKKQYADLLLDHQALLRALKEQVRANEEVDRLARSGMDYLL